MSTYTQDDRPIRFETPLGKDRLLLRSFEGREYVSKPFEFRLKVWSADHDLSLSDLVGDRSTIIIRTDDDSERFVNGTVSAFAHTGTFVLEDGTDAALMSSYEVTLVPWLWKLSLNRDSRIFQERAVPDIVREVFSDYSFSDFEIRLSANYPIREFCVQYRESDLAFVARLLEEEGIYYYFEHTTDKHTLVLGDDSTRLRDLSARPKIDYSNAIDPSSGHSVIEAWESSRRLCTEKVALGDYNFKNPAMNLSSSIHNKKLGRQAEQYDFPGEYDSLDVGDQLARTRFEEERSRESVNLVRSGWAGFVPGYAFELKKHPRKELNSKFIVLAVNHSASQSGNFRSGESAVEYSYTSEFECIPRSVKYRPPRETPVPHVLGSQTAVVVGPKGEEIHVDKHGRVKVHFHWDRVPQNSKSSCWIRVSQPWAGTGFGGMTIPRIGQEVIVDFIEGDPDRPIITGRVYNGAVRPPYELPANKAHSGLMSRSTPGGGSDNFNGVRFNDESGSEKMEIQAEKDQAILVKNDKSEDVLNDETVNIGNDRTENVLGKEVRTIAKDLLRTVLQNQIEVVALNRSKNIGLNDAKVVGLSQLVEVGTDRSVSVGEDENVIVNKNQAIGVGENRIISVGSKHEVSVGAPKAVENGGAGVLIEAYNFGVFEVMASAKALISSPNLVELKSKGSLYISASKEIKIVCGNASITMKNGEITIVGSKIHLNPA